MPVAAERQEGIARTMLALCAANAIASFSWCAQPLQFAPLAVESAFGDTATGWILSAEIGTAAIISIVLGYTVGARFARTFMWLGAFLTLAGNLAAVIFASLPQMLASRTLAGFGEGLLIGSLNAAVASLDDPERRYGMINTVMNVAALVLILVIPYSLGYLQVPRGVFALLAIATVACMPLLLLLPAHDSPAIGKNLVPGVGGWRGWVVCCATLLISTAAASVYPVSLAIGQKAGIAAKEVDAALSVAIIGAIVGSYSAAFTTRRLGIVGSAVLVGVGLVLAPVLLIDSRGVAEFALGMFDLGLFWYLGFTQCLGLSARIDPSGGCAAAAAGAFFLGGGLGPLLGAYEVQWSNGRLSVFVLSMLVLAALMELFVWTVAAHLEQANSRER